MNILGIDPGPVHSAFVVMEGERLVDKGWPLNEDLYEYLCEGRRFHMVQAMVNEWMQYRGMPMGSEVFETCGWIGRFEAQFIGDGDLSRCHRITNEKIRSTICHDTRAKESYIRAALYEMYGGSRRAAVGTKKEPGPLYGMKGHMWSALAVAITYMEIRTSLVREPSLAEIDPA
jgi:hypothetical protein